MIKYKKLKPVKAVIFDMDGLLLDTEKVSKILHKEACLKFGYDLTDEVFVKLIGTNKEASKQILLCEFGDLFPFDDINNAYSKLSEIYYTNNAIVLKSGVNEILDELDRLNIKRAVATSTRRKRAEFQLQRAGISDRFNRLVFGDMVEKSKPEPDIFLKAAEYLQSEADGCIVLEDSVNGIKAAYAAGMMPVMVPDMVEPDENIIKMLYTKCATLHEVINLLHME